MMDGKRVRQYYWRRHMRNYSDPALLLGNQEDLVLMMVSQPLWVAENWRCMISKYVCTEVPNEVFQRRRYFWKLNLTSNTTEKKWRSFLYKYQIVQTKGDYTKLNTTRIEETKSVYEGLFPVYFADDVCMIVGMYVPERPNAKPFCALWMAKSALVKPNKYCFFILFAMCYTPIYNLHEYEQAECKKWGQPFDQEDANLKLPKIQ
uniref:Uncharacterized protein n=1 Tax=Amblyomma triste TaxID=251400 RepID=A0A023G2K3_AMBTT